MHGSLRLELDYPLLARKCPIGKCGSKEGETENDEEKSDGAGLEELEFHCSGLL